MKTKDLTIEECLFHAHANAYLVRGSIHEDTQHRAGCHITGWIARDKPDTLLGRKRYLDAETAKIALQKIVGDNVLPAALVKAADRQQQHVYDWENDLLVPYADPVPDIQSGRKILRQVARDFGIPCPKLVWKEKADKHSEYEEDSHQIFFGHRDKISLLHEMAHAIHAVRLGEKNGPFHSPGFVWIALELYHRYGGQDLPFLIHSASQRGLIGDVITCKPPINLTPAARCAIGLIPI